ncbi:MAG: hypothetical protein ACP5UF_04295 [Hydrogenobaculum sp.]
MLRGTLRNEIIISSSEIVDQKPFDKTLTDELTQAIKKIPLNFEVKTKQSFWSKLVERLKST